MRMLIVSESYQNYQDGAVVNYQLTELVVLVDFKAIYPRVPPGIFASFPGVAHF
jgi:hypothetical protein